MIEYEALAQFSGTPVQGDNRSVDDTKAKGFSRILRSIGAVLSGLIATVVLQLELTSDGAIASIRRGSTNG
jgi:hypothetical protein